jgi:predicted nucleotidyltransferase
MRIIVKMKFGAHLYGTATSDSDLDYKGIFLPTKEQLLLGAKQLNKRNQLLMRLLKWQWAGRMFPDFLRIKAK